MSHGKTLGNAFSSLGGLLPESSKNKFDTKVIIKKKNTNQQSKNKKVPAKPINNFKQKNSRIEMTPEQLLFGWLCRHYSECFSAKKKKPLKLKIGDDIAFTFKEKVKKDLDPLVLNRVLKRYVGDQEYQKSIIEFKKRFDMNGSVVEVIEDKHVKHAENRLSFLIEKSDFIKNGGSVAEFYEEKKQQENIKSVESVESAEITVEEFKILPPTIETAEKKNLENIHE